jgi:triosephosphate isomerase
LAAQNVSAFESGAYTGEVSAQMLREFGVKYCLVGHSERRIYFRESDLEIQQKLEQLLKVNIIPVLCFGETAKERQAKQTMAVIRKQLSILKKVKNPEKIILAYEPVWAISTFQKSKVKKSASDNEIESVHVSIKEHLVKLLGASGRKIPLLYGGSVNADNSKGFLNLDVVDGALVGAASIDSKSFMAIIHNLK